MNIKEAKQEIKNAMTAYFTKNEFGEYVIPASRQRPVFLMGPPGIGKTAIMEQIAEELGVGLISYSMTHHTRQSALGLPFIEKKEYGGVEYSVSEYTMSEIIASVYDMMETTGFKEGILFLDEINCVSETLAPVMLQFLQYKIFGKHKVPDGWIIVTAGNPPEYNNSVREFDIVTWDRLKRIDVEADYNVWKEYAFTSGVHPAVLTYLDIKKTNFYSIETTVDGKSFVTARGWSDLSDMIRLYEKNSIKPNERLISQYIQNRKIAKDFANYYDLFVKYKSDYQVDKIFSGTAGEDVVERAKKAKFDERLSLIGLLLDGITEYLKAVYQSELTLTELMNALKAVRTSSAHGGVEAALDAQIKERKKELKDGKAASNISADKIYALNKLNSILGDHRSRVSLKNASSDEAFKLMKDDFDKRTKELKKQTQDEQAKLSAMFRFCDSAFSDGQEILILVTELTINYYSAHFISRYGCKEYFEHNKALLFYERQKEIIQNIEELKL